jgi:hypothetical protein
VFLEVAIVNIKLHGTNLFHYIHKKFVIFVCKFNEKKKKKLLHFHLTLVLSCASVVGELAKLITSGQQMLQNSIYFNKSTKPATFNTLKVLVIQF